MAAINLAELGLYRHQISGVKHLVAKRGVAALLFDPGTGKSAVVITYAALLAMKLQREVKVLVLAPLSALDSWTSQIERWTPGGVSYQSEALGGSIKRKADVLAARGRKPYKKPQSGSVKGHGTYWHGSKWCTSHVAEDRGGDAKVTWLQMNYDSLRSRSAITKTKNASDLIVDAVRRYDPDLIVFDESHLLKGPTSNTSRTAARLVDIAPRRVLLTGTVMPHSPLDVWSQWRIMDPMSFFVMTSHGKQPMSFTAFKSRYAILGGFYGKEVLGFRRLDEMREIMSHRALVVRKEDALDLPAYQDIEVPVHLSTREQRSYDDMKKQLATMLADGKLASAPNRLTQMMRLRQITAGFLPDDTGNLTPLGDSKVRVIDSLVNDTLAGEKRVVVFSHFRPEIDKLSQALARTGTQVMTITGDTSPQERTRMRQRFGSSSTERMVMVAQTATMSMAVNELVTASHAIFASLSLQRDTQIQARDRLHRIGQNRHVTYYYALAPKTVDTVIHQVQQDRTDLEAALLKHVQDV